MDKEKESGNKRKATESEKEEEEKEDESIEEEEVRGMVLKEDEAHGAWGQAPWFVARGMHNLIARGRARQTLHHLQIANEEQAQAFCQEVVAACQMAVEESSQGSETRILYTKRCVILPGLLLLLFLDLTLPSPLCPVTCISSWVVSSCSLATLSLNFGTAYRLDRLPQAIGALGTIAIEDAVACLSLSPHEVCG